MGQYTFLMFLSIFCIIVFIIGIIMIIESNSFNKNKKIGKAEIVGYSNTWCPMVKICGIESKTSYSCKMKDFIPSQYPIGTILDVEYRKIVFLGIVFYDIEILDKKLKMPDSKSVGKLLLIVALLLLIIIIILLASRLNIIKY